MREQNHADAQVVEAPAGEAGMDFDWNGLDFWLGHGGHRAMKMAICTARHQYKQ
ncbi:hypothetical protein MKD33_06900 [Chromobacterium piscinae]